MLPPFFIFVAILLRVVSGASYLRATWQGKAQPNLVSWLFWSITALIAFTAQLLKGGGPEAFITLAIGLSPLAVCIAALHKRAYVATLSTSDKWCIALTLAGIVLWLISKDPLTALYMSILADIFSNIPTILKAYRTPHTEHAATYGISAISMVLTLLTITDWQLIHWLFTAYTLAINSAIFLVITVLSKVHWPMPWQPATVRDKN